MKSNTVHSSVGNMHKKCIDRRFYVCTLQIKSSEEQKNIVTSIDVFSAKITSSRNSINTEYVCLRWSIEKATARSSIVINPAR